MITRHEKALLSMLGPHTRLHALALLRAHPGLVVTSTYRTPAHNAAVGGSPTSFHLRRRAVDFDGPLWLLRDAAETARSQRVSRSCTGPEEVLVERAGRAGEHLHIAW